MESCVIAAYGRSAIAKAGRGMLSKVNPVDFGAEVLAGVLLKLPRLESRDIDDVIVGCAIPEGRMGLNPARNIVLRAGLPDTVPAQTVNRFCASGIQSVAAGAAMIRSGLQSVVVAGGVESMSDPIFSSAPEYLDEWLLEHSDVYLPMGITGENVAARYRISRARMERFALDSHEKASAAAGRGWFEEEILPVTGRDELGKPAVLLSDEGIRSGMAPEKLAALKPAFGEDGLLTAATSSPRSDGAAFVVLMSEAKAAALGVRPLARFLTYAVTGTAPAYMGLGPIAAIKRALNQAGLAKEQLDVIELNEAFASQALATIDELGLDSQKVNPHGGALALGHPLGATGAILLGKAIHHLQATHGRYALVSMCVGGGMGAACVVEALE